MKLLLPPIHPIYTLYRPVSLALQPFTETWKKLCRLLTSFNVGKVMKNSLFYVKPHNFWMEIECLMNWKMVMEEERRSPFPGSKFSIHFCLSVCSQQLKGFEIGFFSYQFSDIGFFERRVSLHIPRLIEKWNIWWVWLTRMN